MSYFITETIPANTTKNNPLIYNLEIAPLVIDKVDILFPDGCIYLAGVRLVYRSRQIFPYNDREFYIGNGNVVSFTTEYECIEPPFILQLEYFNEDEVFEHRLTVNIDVTFISDRKQTNQNNSSSLNTLVVVRGRKYIN